MQRADVSRWISAYERSWRIPGTGHLSEVFAADARYVVSPWTPPLQGLDAIARMWGRQREGPGEQFTMTPEIVAVDGETAVIRVEVQYDRGTSSHWRDLWIVHFSEDGRCDRFEEWPFAPGQPDGHEHG